MVVPAEITTFNGATVAELILGKLDPNVDHFIDILSTKNSNSLEAPLLEFKGTWRKPEGDNSPDDYHKWNVVKAIVAMYNAYGGCVLVGLAEGHPDKTQLKLLDCDPDGILTNPKNEWKDLQSHLYAELFKGERGQGLFNPNKDESYQMPSASLSMLKRHVTAYLCPSQRYGGNVIALIVSPLASNSEAIYISHKAKRENGSDFKETLLYHRDHLTAESPSIPEAGKPCDPNAWISYFEERQTVLSSTHFRSLLENAPERTITPSNIEKSIGRKIHTYYEHLSKNFHRLNNIFTPLDAEGAISDGSENDIDIFRPTAQSFFGFDDDLDEQVSSTRDEYEFERDDVFAEDDSDESEPAAADDNVTVVKDLIDLIGESNRLAVIGEPGAGKSTCLCYYALKEWREKTSNPSLNIYLSLARWQEGGCSVLGLICNETACNSNEIQYLADHDRLHLLLDALNECPDHLRETAVANIQTFLHQYPSVKVTITSRKEDDTHGFKFSTFTIQPMGREQQLRFLGKYLPTNQNVSALLDKILSQPGGDSIAANPMLLGMVADIVKKGGALPRGRATLYQTWLSRWYERECKKAKRASNPLPVESPQEALGLLSRIAFTGRLHGYRDIPIQLVESELQTNELALAKRICEGPLLSIENDTLHFRHETFQEYLCAEHLVRHKDALDDLETIDYGTWGMPLAYMVELLALNGILNTIQLPIEAIRRADTWFNVLLQLQNRSSPYHILASTKAFSEPTSLSEDSLKKEFRDTLATLIAKDFQWATNIPLKYVISSIPSFYDAWKTLEINCLKLWIAANSTNCTTQDNHLKTKRFERKLLPNFIIIKPDCRHNPSDETGCIAQEFFQRLCEKISTVPSHKIIKCLIDCKWGIVDDFRPAIKALIRQALPNKQGIKQSSLRTITNLIDRGWTTKNELNPTIANLINLAIDNPSLNTTIALIQSGLVKQEDIKPAIAHLINTTNRHPTTHRVYLLIKNRLATHLELSPAFKLLKRTKFTTIYHQIELQDNGNRESIARSLAGQEFDAVCTEAHGRTGFLEHPCFESRIPFRSRKDKVIEGQEWRVVIGVRFNPRRERWFYTALSATLLKSKPDENEQFSETSNTRLNASTAPSVTENITKPDIANTPALSPGFYQSSILDDPTQRDSIADSLKGRIFDTICIKAYGRNGYLKHQCFKETIFLHRSVISDVNISTGQHWRITVGISPNSKRNRWYFVAQTAELLSDAPENDSFAIAISHADQQHPPIENPIFRNRRKVADLPLQKINTSYSTPELQDGSKRKAIIDSLSGRTFTTVCIKAFEDFAFLSNPNFDKGIFLHKSIIPIGDKIETCQKWRITIGARFNRKQNLWCYAAQTAELLSQSHVEETDSATQPSFSEIATAKHISIYIDETWPGTQDATYKDIGVIGGIVVAGDGWKKKILPVIKTHIRDYNYARKITRQMLDTPGVFPFVLPIKLDRNAGASYFELVQHAILLLIGWLLPQGEHDTLVDIYLEHITQFPDGHSETNFFNVLQQAMKLLGGSKRFARWQIRQVKWVPKAFEFVPYADLVCQTCVPLHDQQKFAQDVHARTWPGFLPFTPDLFPLLRDMDTASPSGFADLLISFARTSRDTPLFKRVLRQAVERAQREAPFRDTVLERFEICYEQKDRDIALLNRLTEPFFDAFPLETFSDSPRMRLLRILLEMQRANHNGDPEAVNRLVADYKIQRQRLISIDRELSAYADMNLIVHDHDLFLFEEGLSTANSWIDDPLFPALSLVNRGRMLSSRGQSYALLKRHKDADREFNAALSLFESEAQLYRKEIDQTRVYQCFNLLDLEPSRAVDAMETILHNSLPAAGKDPASALGNPFHEHLFLKLLWTFRRELKPTTQDYLTHSADWPAIHDCHPYELILFYRTLLIFDHDRNTAQIFVRNTEELFERMSYGGTIGLIHSYIRVIFKRMGIGTASDAEFNDELNIVEGYLPTAKSQINTLRHAWEDPSIDISSVLPFNYK